MVLKQVFLDSEWGQYELDQALMQTLEDASFKFLIILLQDKATLKKVPRWLRGYLRTNIYIEKNDPLFFRKLVMGMPLEEVEPQRPGEMPVLYGSNISDVPMAAVNSELTTADGDVTDAELEAYINRAMPCLVGDGGTTNRDTQPLLDADNI